MASKPLGAMSQSREARSREARNLPEGRVDEGLIADLVIQHEREVHDHTSKDEIDEVDNL